MNDNLKAVAFILLVGAVYAIGLVTGAGVEHRKACAYNKVDASEYQFVVVDDSVIVKDFGRNVGKVKLEGELLKLIDKDNE